MRERFYKGIVSGERKGFIAFFLRGIFRFLSLFFYIAYLLRKTAYAIGLKRPKKAAVPVVSIGNITAGGTGKTPLVALAARILKEAGHSPAVLSRGYKAKGGLNDEALVLRRRAPGIPHLQGPDRLKNARRAVRENGADCIVLDDGFQHWRIARDLDLVTLDALSPFGFGKMLPAGLLREPLAELMRADMFVLTHADKVTEKALKILLSYLSKQAPGVPVAAARHKVTGLTQVGGNTVLPPKKIKGKKVLAFCGIGNPRSFDATLKALGAQIAAFFPMTDHQYYSDFLLDGLDKAAVGLKVDMIATTEKDAVKLEGWEPSVPCFSVDIETEIFDGLDIFKDRLLGIMEKKVPEGT